MKLFTRLAITIFASTLFPFLLVLLMMTGKISYETMNGLHILLSLILLFYIYRSIVRPLDRLRQAVDRLKEGDLSSPIEAEKKDEIGELTEDFDELRVQLKKSAEEIRENEIATRELVGNIAHDLKTPITTIHGYAEGLRDGIASTPEMQNKYLQTICNKSNEMTALIEELTFYAKMEANNIPYNFMKVRAKYFFDDHADEISIDMDAKGVRFCYSCDLDTDVCVLIDPEQLHKVINNIINNSVKYVDKDEKVIEMHVYDVGEYIRCDMWDNGNGVSKDELEKIFERFYRSDKSRGTAKGGSGIGLSIVKKIIEDHHGQIWATSEKGSGLAMHFLLRKYVEVGNNGKENSDS